jgi:hypothetical protein
VAAGATASYSISLTQVNGGAGDVNLTVGGLPAGAVATFTPATIPGGSGGSTLSVTTAAGTASGNYTLLISLAAAGVIHHDSVNLTVTGP